MESQDVRIVIMQRGWVFVGKYSRSGDYGELRSAKCIRRWGTTRGLGELFNGPLKDTELDHFGQIEFHALSEVASIKVNSESWHAVLG